MGAKNYAGAFCFISLAQLAFAQINHGSIGVIYFTQDKIAMAADSRAIYKDRRPPRDNYCKIAAADSDLIFVSTGAAAYESTFPFIQSWDNTIEMLGVYRQFRRSGRGLRDQTAEVATQWATIIQTKFSELLALVPSEVAKAVDQDGVLTAGFLGGLTSAGSLELFRIQVIYRTQDMPPIRWRVDPVSCPFANFCGIGNVDVLDEFVNMRTDRARRENALETINDDDETAPETYDMKRAMRFVNLTIQYQQGGPERGDVGGPVDAAELNRDGTVRWYNRKDNCQEME